MSLPEEQGSGPSPKEVRSTEIEALADDLMTLVAELEAAVEHGRIPVAFAERLTELRRRTERLLPD